MLTASALLLAGVIFYAALCAIRPFGPCRKCDGTGTRERRGKPDVCRRCRGERLRLRTGRRAFNAWLRTRQAGARPTPTAFKENR
ncbi:hypothetical protein ACIBCU_26360 [Streptomyces sp. NPDC051064]|uniref:hypothetical protein n=1 Tax=Streptomyces sp. NPDC051064 TaxID=3365641 RepID=UPI0037A81493